MSLLLLFKEKCLSSVYQSEVPALRVWQQNLSQGKVALKVAVMGLEQGCHHGDSGQGRMETVKGWGRELGTDMPPALQSQSRAGICVWDSKSRV